MTHVDLGDWFDREHPAGAVVVGYNGKEHSRTALAWGAREAVRREAPLLVLYAANYSGMTLEPGPGLHHRDPGALDAASDLPRQVVVVESRIYSQAQEAVDHPGDRGFPLDRVSIVGSGPASVRGLTER